MALGIPDLAPASDSGASNADDITNVALPSISGTGGAPGLTVTLSDLSASGTATLGTAIVDAGGNWVVNVTLPATLVEGGNTITATETDGVTTSDPSPPLNVTLDSFAGPPSVALATADDTGTSNSDGITNVALPTFVGTTGDEGSVVTLFNGATLIGTGTSDAAGNYSILATAPLTEGPNAITAVKTDLAGNISPASAPLNVTLDTGVPAAPSTPVLNAGNGGNGGTAIVGGSISVSATLSDVDISHNDLSVERSSAHDMALGIPDLAPASDSGASNADDITNVALPSISGTGGAPGLTVTLSDLSASGTATLGTAIVDAGGNWVVNVTLPATLVEGGNTITATETDGVTTSDPSPPLNVTLDSFAGPPSVALATADDTGTSNSDGITNVALPTFVGTTGDEGSVVTLFNGATLIGTGTSDAAGNYSILATAPLTEGPNAITAVKTDLAGNISPASAPLNVTLDTGVPAAPSTPDLGLTPVPTVTAVTAAPSDAVLGAAALVALTLTLSAPVTVNTTGGTPTLTLNNGATATFVSGSGTASLVFDYTVAVGQDTPDLAVTAANLNGATVTDSVGNAPDLTGAAVNPPGTLAISSIAAFDTTTNQPVSVIANAYTGPAARLQNEYINITPDNLNITADTPNWFIHSGSGDDAIAVSRGTNVLDGGTGSNFLTGGRGPDTFFVDDRELTADVWSTVEGFGVNDSATIWGVTPQDFGIEFADDEGAEGFTGLTVHATADGLPTASLTLAGFTQADVTSGRLSVTFGTDEASGSDFMFIHANS